MFNISHAYAISNIVYNKKHGRSIEWNGPQQILTRLKFIMYYIIFRINRESDPILTEGAGRVFRKSKNINAQRTSNARCMFSYISSQIYRYMKREVDKL